MADLTNDDFDAANERGRIHFETVPHARSAHFDRASGRVSVELYNGCGFSFPARQVQGLQTATDDELATVEVIGLGYGLSWETLDIDVTVEGLMAGRFGNEAHMAPLRARLRAILEEAINDQRHAA